MLDKHVSNQSLEELKESLKRNEANSQEAEQRIYLLEDTIPSEILHIDALNDNLRQEEVKLLVSKETLRRDRNTIAALTEEKKQIQLFIRMKEAETVTPE